MCSTSECLICVCVCERRRRETKGRLGAIRMCVCGEKSEKSDGALDLTYADCLGLHDAHNGPNGTEKKRRVAQ